LNSVSRSVALLSVNALDVRDRSIEIEAAMLEHFRLHWVWILA